MKNFHLSLFVSLLFGFITQSSLQAQVEVLTSRTVEIELGAFRRSLINVPLQNSAAAREPPHFILLPMPEGVERQFKVELNALMSPDFATKYPDFKTYDLQAADDPTVIGHMTVTPYGLLATIFTSQGIIEIYPEDMKSPVAHRVALQKGSLEDFKCGFEEGSIVNQSSVDGTSFMINGVNTMIYNLAIATTGEYAQTHGGTVATATAVVIQMIGALENILEKELAVKFNLLTPKVYLDPDTDPFPSDNANRTRMAADAIAMNWPNHTDYDLGHVLHSTGGGSTWGGGVAYYGLCSDGYIGGEAPARYKAGAWSSVGSSPTGLVDLIAHEMGHQFHMPHTFNGSGSYCDANINSSASYEIGSGSTIMSYNGSCGSGQNLPYEGTANNYYHTTSLEAAFNAIQSTTCGVAINSGNTPPTIEANPCGGAYTIPIGTPFKLTGSGTDANGDQILYNWEQVDEDGPGMPTQGKIGAAAAADPLAPLFRSYPPELSPIRYFPNLELIKANDYASSFEPLPTVARTLNFHLTGRDNDEAGGGVNISNLAVTVNATGPFSVSAPNGGETFSAGATTTVSWDVNGTDAFCSSVNIKLSIDGGSTYPYTLAGSTSNDGEAEVTFPTVVSNTSSARLMIECAENSCVVFFDISDADFTVTSSCSIVTTNICPVEELSLQQGDPGLNLGFSSYETTPVTSLPFTVTAADPDMNRIQWNNDRTSCITTTGTFDYQVFSFMVDLPGTYYFYFNAYRVAYLFSDPFDPNGGCNNFMTSSWVDGIGVYSTFPGGANLESCTVYHFAVTGNNGAAITASFSGPGNIYPVVLPSGNTAYTYAAVNTATDQVAAVDAEADFTSLGTGDYHVYGASYYSGAGPDPALVNPASWVGQSLTAITSSSCILFSENYRPVNIHPVCDAPTIENISITQPTCAVPSDMVTVTAIGSDVLELDFGRKDVQNKKGKTVCRFVV